MNYKKTLLTTSIIAILFGSTQANDYISIITQEKHVYDVIENSFPVATEWLDIGSEFNCIKEFSAYDYPLGQSFTQNENCLQKQERTITTTQIFNSSPRTTVKVENQNIPVVVSYLETGQENFNTDSQRNEYSTWLDDGSHYGCNTFTPLVSTINLGESFNQNRSCLQDQNRTETIYDIWADGSEILDSTNIETRTLTELEYNSATGTKNFNTGSQRTEYTNWLDDGEHYACATFAPLVSTVNLGESFEQNRDCSQDQNRTKTIYDIWANNSETTNSTIVEVQTLTENETQNSIGTKNFNTGSTRVEYTNWLDDGVHYGCDTFSPFASTVNLGESFEQNRDCSQDQNRTKTIYDIWADNSETVDSTSIETQILTENEVQNSIGTKNFNTGIQRTEYSNWLDDGTHYACDIFTPIVSTVNLGESFEQNRDCSQDQNRTKTIYDIWADNSETVASTNIENQTLTENETQDSTGTKNYDTGANETTYTNWVDTGALHSCTVYTPSSDTVRLGESLTQKRDCSQDQSRTKTIKSIWANGTKTVDSNTIEVKTLIENESLNTTGTGLSTSCKVILDKGWSIGSGMYLLSDNSSVYCEMVAGGGGFQLKTTREYIPDGNMTDGTGVDTEAGSNPVNNIVTIPNPVSNYALQQPMGTTESHRVNEYEIHPDSCNLVTGDYIALTAWTDVENANIFHNRYYDFANAPYSDGGSAYLINTEVVNGKTWYQYRYMKPVPSNSKNISPIVSYSADSCHNWYVGYGGYKYVEQHITGFSFQVYTR